MVKCNIGKPDTLNEYKYCLNNPMKYVDRDGRKEENEGDESEYVKVYYLYDEDGANGAGHIALLLEKEDGTGEIYSYSTSWEGLNAVSNVLGFENDCCNNYWSIINYIWTKKSKSKY